LTCRIVTVRTSNLPQFKNELASQPVSPVLLV